MAENTAGVEGARNREAARGSNVDSGENEGKKKELSKIVSSIKSRYKSNIPFNEQGSRLMVVANPKQSLDLFSDAVSYKYVLQTLKQDTHRKPEDELPPHLFALAGNALRRVLDNNEDTCVVFLGDTESGKTESSRLFMRQLTRLSRAANQNSKKVASRINYVDTVFDAFGSFTSRNQSSRSLVTRYTEIQYNQSEIIGAKLVTYLLNSQYITQRHPADRNVNVLHYLLAGATREEIIQYRLDTAATSPYIKIGKGGKSTEDAYKSQTSNDRIRFNELREYLKYLGFGRRSQSHIFRALSLILHLGLLSFVDNSPDAVEEGNSYYCTVKTPSELELIAELMGVDAENRKGGRNL